MKLFNSLTRKKETFTPLNDKKVTLYVCGITPYDTTHLGHAFTYIWFDVLIRYLKFKGYEVTYTQNVTDINDRDNDILKKSLENNTTWQKLAEYWTKKFLEDMTVLNWIMPDNYLKASKNIQSMINLIQKLMTNGFAYEKNKSVYFDISKKKDFGKLSKLTKEQMLKIAKEFDEDIENPDKKTPLDITLWRASFVNQPDYIPEFASPFGMGRPGWHIECSAMSTVTLGDQIDPFGRFGKLTAGKLRVNGEHSRTIDIHGGGIDLMYPHHEAEIAQSEGAAGKIPFAKYWVHVAPVFYQGKKMSKSLKNLVMISDLRKKFSTNAIRFVLLSHHYREAWEFEEKELYAAEALLAGLKNVKDDSSELSKFINFMGNDLQANLVLKNLKSWTVMKILGFTF